MTRLVLVGGGHSQVHVLKALARQRSAQIEVTLISREVRTPYSGMLPGVVAGHYAPEDAFIDLAPLCKAAGASLVQAEVNGLDLSARQVMAGDRTWPYDLLSINCGSAPGLAAIDGAGDVGIPVKPFSGFLAHWDSLLTRLRAGRTATTRLAVVGAGAGGIEMALALDYRLRAREGLRGASVILIEAGKQLLPGQASAMVRRVSASLARRGIEVLLDTRIARVDTHGLVTTTGERLAADEILWTVGAGAQSWVGASGLDVDAGGFIRVDSCLRSLSHPEVFASGDIASFAPRELPKAGVFAVRQGPFLATNLLRASRGKPLATYKPQRRYLVLLSTGDRYALAVRGNWTAEGVWVWRWKDWIDRRFVRRFKPA
jgi:selenide,water dikinase